MNPDELKTAFTRLYGNAGDVHVFFAPGRVNLIGEHIDYNGGYVFPGALTIGTFALARRRNDHLIRLNSLNAGGEVVVDTRADIRFDEKDGWGNYPKGVCLFLRNEGYSLGGYDILYWGDLPDGAGLSSSAALEVVTGFLLLTLGTSVAPAPPGEEVDKVWLAQLCQKVENQFIHVNSGIMDQFCVAMGKQDHALLLNTQSLEYQHVPFQLRGYRLMVMNSNKRRELINSRYNERRAECDRVLAILNQHHAYPNLCAAPWEAVAQLVADETLRKRARHVITENQRVLKAVDVLKAGDLNTFGELLNAAHQSMRDDYELVGFEVDTLVGESQRYPGCVGARMTGGDGFGGCALAIVKEANAADFKQRIGDAYAQKTGFRASFYPSQIGEGVHRVA
ncbi:MAG: galactokinase [Ferruginibacter sp.]|nr:galactokinase [Cytophagales bacterium]